MEKPAARLVVTRTASSARDIWRRYRVEVDGRRIGTLKRGQSLTVDLSPGSHRVQALIDFEGSHPLEVNVPPGEEARLVVEPSEHLMPTFGLATARDPYLVLRPES
ncbi:hypothetical protein [Cryptosporangium japonicum]|uniref:PEGA domain-containing protein n=1 Tax=Cryptosporangium japonicum TaxID=80872 RepID=A0ABN0UE47_9ACTN